MRIRVIDILQMLASGMRSEQICQQLPDLEEDDIRASLAYAAHRLEESHQAVGTGSTEHGQRSLIAFLGTLEGFTMSEESKKNRRSS
jgi:uncharacterized protein DUF433